MSGKRKYPSSPFSDNLYNKRSRTAQLEGNDESPSASQPRIDATYGQRGAFPGLEDTREDDLFYGPAGDGLEYLRMVRSEAKTVPNLLIAPASPTLDDVNGSLYADYPQGYYADGAYTATPFSSSDDRLRTDEQSQEEPDTQEAYYASLCARFAAISKAFQSPPPNANDTSLGPPLARLRTSQWRHKLLHTTPKIAQIGYMLQEDVVYGLEVLTTVLTSSNLRGKHGKSVGTWCWCLLAKCREMGQMSSEEVGVLRDLGKQAIWLLRRIAAGEKVEEQQEDLDSSQDIGVDQDEGTREEERDCLVGEDENFAAPNADDVEAGEAQAIPLIPEKEPEVDGFDAALAEAKQRILVSLGSSNEIPSMTDKSELINGNIYHNNHDNESLAHEHTNGIIPSVSQQYSNNSSADSTTVHATLDMLVTIIGEFYGQKDLLGGRLLWDEMEQANSP